MSAGAEGQAPAPCPSGSRLTASVVKAQVGDKEVWALVDSGADFTMIRDGLQTDIQRDLGCQMTRPSRPARGAGGEPLHIVGVLSEIPIRIRDQSFTCASVAVVSGLVYDVVLGRDFCCRYGTIIDDQQGVLRLAGMSIPLPTYGEIRPTRARVLLTAATVVPARSALIVPARVAPLDGKVRNPSSLSGVFEPSHTAERENLLIPREVVTVDHDGTVPIRLTNTSSGELKLLKGSDIGTLFSILPGVDNEFDLCDDKQTGVRHAVTCVGPGVRNVTTSSTPAQCASGALSAPDDRDDRRESAPPVVDVESSGMSAEGRAKLRHLVAEYQDIFSHHSGDIGRTHLTKHHIDTGDALPIRQPPRRIPASIREQVEVQKEQMLRDGVIEPSDSPWCSPVVLARKKDGSFRFCVDMRAVNSVTKGLAHPLPRIDDALDSLAGARWYTTLDMATGYWQVEIAPEDREKTAFTTGRGLHQFRVMAMGLKNAGGTFQRLMELVLAGLDTRTCLVYLDDIILFNKTEHEHLATLKDVFERIRGAGLKLKPQKCHLAKSEVTFLGHSVSEAGVKPDPRNIDKVLTWPEPADDSEMNSFLGLCGYYANFIEGYAEISRPLRNAALTPGKLVWTAEMRQAFTQLKSILASPPVLSLPRFRGTFVLYTDACNTTVGSVLTERIDGEERVIAYDSKVLTKQQVKWPTYDKELWAVVHAIRRFRQYTTGAKFLVVTDHKPLANIPQSIAVERDGTGRRGRWAVELSSFEFDVEIKAGVKHCNADALSRRPAESGMGVVPTPEAAAASVSGAKPSVTASHFRKDKPRSGDTGTGVCPDPDRVGGVETKSASRALKGSHASGGMGTGVRPDPDHATQTQATLRALKGSPFPDGTDTGVCPDPDHTSKRGVQATVNVSLGTDGNDTPDIRQAQEQDCSLQEIRSRLESGVAPVRSKMGPWGKVLLPRWKNVEMREGVIGLVTGEGFRAAVPRDLREEILKMAHNHPTSGHMGRRRTSFRVRQRFIWPGMYQDIRAFCDACIPCQRRHRPSPAKRAPMVTETTSMPFERIAVDVTEMPTSLKGNNCALVIMDYFSKYVRIYPMADQKTETILEGLLDWVHDFGVPDRLHSDQGRQFESRVFQAMCERLGIHKTRTTPYHPESDGMVERFNRTLKDMISKYVDAEGLHWDVDIKAYSMAYNSSIHSVTGYTPFYLVHGYEPRIPLDVEYGPAVESVPVRSFLEDRLRSMRTAYNNVRRNAARTAKEAAERYNAKQCAEEYHIGDKVWVRDFRAAAGGKPKLGLPFTGPSTIIGKVGAPGKEVAYKVANKDGKVRVLHHNHLKPSKPSNERDQGTRGTSMPTGEAPPREEGGDGSASALPTDKERSQMLLLLHQPSSGHSTPAPPVGRVGEDNENPPEYGPPAPFITRSGRVSRPVVPYQVSA